MSRCYWCGQPVVKGEKHSRCKAAAARREKNKPLGFRVTINFQADKKAKP